MGLFLFFLVIVVVLVWYLMTHDTTPAEQQANERSAEEVLAEANVLLAMTEAATQAKELGRDDVYDAIMANQYDGPLPEKRSDGAWTSIFDELRILSIAGINHRQNIVRYKGRTMVALVPEPSNEFDPNAIKIVAEDGHHLGYIRQDQTEMVRAWSRDTFPHYCAAMIQEHDDDTDGHRYYTGYIYYIKKKAEG